MTNNKGFTLIELMIVIAIIGIIAAIALPAYQEYIARAQINEAIILTAGLKSPMTTYFQSSGVVPSMSDVGGTSQGKYVESITISNFGTNGFIIEATMKLAGVNNKIQGKIFGMESSNGGTTWKCGTLAGNTGNNIGANYLPSSCK